MNEKIFSFRGMDVKQLIIGVILLILFTLCGFFLPFIFLDNVSTPSFSVISVLIIGGLYLKTYTKVVPKIWSIRLFNNHVEVYFGRKLLDKFILSEIDRIKIRGWNKQKSYKLLRLSVKQRAISIYVDNITGGITSPYEMKTFGEWIEYLEEYASQCEFKKTDLRKDSAHSNFINFCLEK
ncbi:MAG: hypothetical protein ACK5NT_05625 [Pyrinomonadaceae bacterium]